MMSAMIRSRRLGAAAALAALVLAAAERASADPAGAAGFAVAIEGNTTVALTPDEARDLGRRELDRILADVRGVMAETGFEGTTEAFFAFLRDDDRFYQPDTAEGRAAYLAEAQRILDEMQARAGELIDPPPALRPLAAEEMDGGAGTVAAAAYGGRAIRFNLSDMRSAPTFMLAPIAYHEGVPGHHLQFAVPRAEGAAMTPAFIEGWGHYAESLPDEIDLYPDPYARAGMLSLQAWRAARLLVDVGYHVDSWTRDEAVAFMLANTPLSERQVGLEVDRVMSAPAATSVYFIGKLKIEELRARAEAALGPGFDLRRFHRTMLEQSVPTLSALEEAMDAWLAAQTAR